MGELGESYRDAQRGMWAEPAQLVSGTARRYNDPSMTAGYATGPRREHAVPDVPAVAPASGVAVRRHLTTGPRRSGAALPDTDDSGTVLQAPAAGVHLDGRAWTGPTRETAIPETLQLGEGGLHLDGRAWTGPTRETAVPELFELGEGGVTGRNEALRSGRIAATAARDAGIAEGWADRDTLESAGFRGMDLSRQAHGYVGTVPMSYTDDWGAVQAVTQRSTKLRDPMLRRSGAAIAEWNFGAPLEGVATDGRYHGDVAVLDGDVVAIPEAPEGTYPITKDKSRFSEAPKTPRLQNTMVKSMTDDLLRMSAPGQFV